MSFQKIVWNHIAILVKSTQSYISFLDHQLGENRSFCLAVVYGIANASFKL